MIIYNITTKVEHSTHQEWLQWMQQAYIPQLMESGFFEDYKLARLLGVDESDGPTYALQFSVANRLTFNLYQQKMDLGHQTMLRSRFGEQALTFRSVLEVVERG